MYLKLLTKEGEKYYINAFTGVTVKIPTVNPLKREPNPEIQQMMFYSKAPYFGSNLKQEALNNQKTIFIGDFKKLMKIKPEKRDRMEFIIACRRININPWELMDVTYHQYYNLIFIAPEIKLPVEIKPIIEVKKITLWRFILSFLKKLFN